MARGKFSGGQQIFELVSGMRFFGAGVKVKPANWQPHKFYVLTRVRLSKDQSHGKAYGVLHYRNSVVEPREIRIKSAHRKGWEVLGLPNYQKFDGKVDLAALPKPAYQTTAPQH